LIDARCSKRMRRVGAGLHLLVVAMLSGVLFSCSRAADEGDSKNPANVVAVVTMTQVTRESVLQTITVTGAVAGLPNEDVRVSAMVPGRIAEMKVAEGDAVSAGEILARLDDRVLRDQLRQADAVLLQARATLDNAKLNRARNDDLVNRGIAARKDLEDARMQESVAAGALQQAEAADQLAKLQLQRAEIASPISGRVAHRFVGIGEQVDGTGAQPIAEVANLAEVDFNGNVPAKWLASVRTGQPLNVASASLPGRTFSGRVVAVSPAVDPATNAGLIRVRIPNPDGALRLGLYLSAQIPVATHDNALCLPPDAVYRDSQNNPHVYRVSSGVAKAVPVTLGLQSPDRIEILSGVQQGDNVILTGGFGLPDGAQVQVKQ
jgi:membrane fusion protein (multidrug efflux system)